MILRLTTVHENGRRNGLARASRPLSRGVSTPHEVAGRACPEPIRFAQSL